MYDFHNIAVFFLWWSTNCKNETKSVQKLCLSPHPFPTICTPLPQKYVTIFWYKNYQYIIKMVLTNSVICFSQCGFVSEFGVHVIYCKTWHDT